MHEESASPSRETSINELDRGGKIRRNPLGGEISTVRNATRRRMTSEPSPADFRAAPPENIPSHKLEHCVCRLMDAPERWVGELGGDLVRS